MARWKTQKYDKLAKREKVRKSKRGQVASDLIEEEFETSPASWEQAIREQGYFAARVVEVHKRYAFVSSEPQEGEVDTRDVWIATVARKYLQADRRERNFFAVGDRVLCRPGGIDGREVSEDLPACTVEQRAPRATKIARLDPMTPEREHVLAANATQLIIVASYVYPKVKWGLIDRYLTLAEEEGLKTVIILNKRDLLAEQKPAYQEECASYRALYQSLGYPVLSVQAAKPTPEEVAEITQLFVGEISLLSGHSGVGKSSIVNLMRPEISQDVEDEDILTKGRHTTTYASFIRLGTGGYVIDSPGIRSFLIQERTSLRLSWCFVEMRPLINHCKFRECQHREEPECAVREAVRAGRISVWRYKSYLGLLTGATGREGRMREINLNDQDERIDDEL